MRILIVDDHEVVRSGLKALLNQQEGFEVVGEAGTVADSIQQAALAQPDVAVMDVRLPDGSGVEACREIRAATPTIKVIMLTSYPDEEAVFDSIMAGASGYLLKQVRGRELVEAIRRVGQGESLLDPGVTQRVLERLKSLSAQRGQEGESKLTEQEEKVLAKVAEGKTNREIAEELFLSEKTVKNYVSSLLNKLNLSRRAEAAAYYVRTYGQRKP